ncbi:hypothetical protein BJX68DRAFT_237051, partial [Aspergillus pseudodeflectus]
MYSRRYCRWAQLIKWEHQPEGQFLITSASLQTIRTTFPLLHCPIWPTYTSKVTCM